jgi:septal ring factor EnvC (AmiA/AmiB activator)
MGNMMEKFASVVGGLKNMLGSLTERIAMIEEEVSELNVDKNANHFEIDENESEDEHSSEEKRES